MYQKIIIFFLMLTAMGNVLSGQTKTDPHDLDSTKVFRFQETMPVFPGGDEAIYKIIEKNYIYPKEGLKADFSR